jgi:hypothetical protein
LSLGLPASLAHTDQLVSPELLKWALLIRLFYAGSAEGPARAADFLLDLVTSAQFRAHHENANRENPKGQRWRAPFS